MVRMDNSWWRGSSDFERLCSLNVLDTEDRGQDDQLQIYKDFEENIVRREDGQYEGRVPWIPGSKLKWPIQ